MGDTRGELADRLELLRLRDVMLQFDLFGNVFSHEYPAGPLPLLNRGDRQPDEPLGPITLTQTHLLPVAPALHHADDFIPVPWYW